MVAFAAGALASLAGAVGSAATGAATTVGSALGLGGAAAAAPGSVGLGALTSLGSSTAATAGASVFSGSTPSIFASILQGGSGLIGAMGAIRQGQAQQQSDEAQATAAELDAGQQQITAEQQATGLRQKLVDTLGQRDVAYAASGVDLSFGTPVAARGQAIQDASDAISENDDNAAGMQQQLLARAAMYRQMGSEAADAGDVSALGDVLETGAKIAFGSGKNASGI